MREHSAHNIEAENMTPDERRTWRESHGCDRNKTDKDAYERVVAARLGSFVDATDEYLLALRQRLAAWDQEIQAELAERIALAAQDAFDKGLDDHAP